MDMVEEAVDTRRIRVRLALVAWSHPCPRTEAAVRELRREQARAEGVATTPEEEAAADAHLARVVENELRALFGDR